MTIARSYENGKFRLDIHFDEDPENPRTEWDNFGHMVCYHPDYNLGDKADHEGYPVTQDSLIEFHNRLPKLMKKKEVLALPLYLYDHSGITMSTGHFACDSAGWDTSAVGYIYVTKEEVKKEYGNFSKKSQEKAYRQLETEVEIYADYLEGNVYGFTVDINRGDSEDEDWEEDVDSCWGFYGWSYGLLRGNGDRFAMEENGMWGNLSEEVRKMIDPKYEQDPKGYWIDKQLELPLENSQLELPLANSI